MQNQREIVEENMIEVVQYVQLQKYFSEALELKTAGLVLAMENYMRVIKEGKK